MAWSANESIKFMLVLATLLVALGGFSACCILAILHFEDKTYFTIIASSISSIIVAMTAYIGTLVNSKSLDNKSMINLKDVEK